MAELIGKNGERNGGAGHQYGIEKIPGNAPVPGIHIIHPLRHLGHRPDVFVNLLIGLQRVHDQPEDRIGNEQEIDQQEKASDGHAGRHFTVRQHVFAFSGLSHLLFHYGRLLHGQSPFPDRNALFWIRASAIQMISIRTAIADA